jgi:5'-nucleotidase
MHILLTNDDGINAPGLLALKQALERFGRISVVAPSRNYSAAGHRKTMHKPLRIDPTQLLDDSPAWVCSGAPSDCVALALLGFIKEKVDLVVSGINPNNNLGQDVTYSGTVTAAIEAVIAGVPGMAVSTDAGSPPNYAPAAQVAAQIAERIAERGLPPNVLLNVNVPETQALRGLLVTRQGLRVYRDQLVERLDPRGKPYYWIGGEYPIGRVEEGTDFWALEHGYVSVTPLHLDMTAYKMLDEVRAWIEAP